MRVDFYGDYAVIHEGRNTAHVNDLHEVHALVKMGDFIRLKRGDNGCAVMIFSHADMMSSYELSQSADEVSFLLLGIGWHNR